MNEQENTPEEELDEMEESNVSDRQFFLHFIYLINYLFCRQRGSEGEREGEKHQCVVASHMPPRGDLAHNCWESSCLVSETVTPHG